MDRARVPQWPTPLSVPIARIKGRGGDADSSGMKRTLPLVLALWLGGTGSVAADVFRCVDAEGTLRFVDTPHACTRAVPHRLERRLERAAGTPAAPAAAAGIASARDLTGLLLDPSEAGDGWEVVEEVPGQPSRDPDLVRWGVRAQQARHYTRDVGGVAEVCSIELWRFASREQAEAARKGFSYPDWQIDRSREILVMVRGLRRPRQGAPQRGVFPACETLGGRVRARTGGDADRN